MDMQHYQKYNQTFFPAQLLPLIQDYAGDDQDDLEILKALASSIVLSRKQPTRLAFMSVSEVLSTARQEGFADPEINRFLAALEAYLNAH